jgi:NAD(P)-dependent dehydrogenase (short-subunit alcohol dehydrogenase family)
MSVVLITGCSSGFGKLSAIAFARRGDTVFASMRDTSRSQALRDEAAAAGVSVEIIHLDVNDRASVEAAVVSIQQVAGRIDVLVNNAGIGAVAPTEEFDDDEFLRVFDTNVFGVLRTTRAVLPLMRAQRSGRIVNVGSLAGIVASPFRGIYSASKAAVEAITDAMYYELHPFGIHMCVVEPGFFETAISDNRMPLRRDEDASPYADLFRRYEDASSKAPGGAVRADPQAVADIIVRAATEEQPKRRYPVGKDAELIAPLHKQMSDEEFEKVMRTTLDFWD